MKNSFKATVITACMACAGVYSCAQSPVGNATPVQADLKNAYALIPPRPGQPGPPMGRHLPNNGLQQLTAINGKVTGYLANDHYEYDGLTLQTSSNQVNVRFPAHLASQLMKAAAKGSTISVTGFYEIALSGTNDFHFINAGIGSTLIADTQLSLPVVPPVEEQKSFTGTISDFRRNNDGMVNGVILGGNKVVELPPPAAGQLQGLLKAGEKVSGTGVIVTPPTGIVMSQNVEAIRPLTLTLNGQTYLVR